LRYHLKPLPQHEIKDYVLFRLKKAGKEDASLFDDDVYPYLYRYTGGIPRLLNVLCDTALIVAYADNSNKVTVPIIKDAIKELQWVTYRRRKEKLKKSVVERKNAVKNYTHNDLLSSMPLDIDLAALMEE
jgi:general secretion pathway protein A